MTLTDSSKFSDFANVIISECHFVAIGYAYLDTGPVAHHLSVSFIS